MATWEVPIDSQTDPDAPITSQLGKRWDNNVIAAFQGASGAPGVSLTALEDLAAGSSIRWQILSTASTSSLVFESIQKWRFVQEGVVRITLTQQRTSGSGSHIVEVRKNGSVEQTWATDGTAQSRSLDMTLSLGDTVEVFHRADTSGGAGQTADLRLRTNGEYIYPFAVSDEWMF